VRHGSPPCRQVEQRPLNLSTPPSFYAGRSARRC
jgi:hypothetical protein